AARMDTCSLVVMGSPRVFDARLTMQVRRFLALRPDHNTASWMALATGYPCEARSKQWRFSCGSSSCRMRALGLVRRLSFNSPSMFGCIFLEDELAVEKAND